MLKDELDGMISRLREAQLQYDFELSTLPEGKLSFSKAGNKGQYYQRLYVDGKLKRNGISKKPELVKQLARKEYLIRMLENIDHDLRIFEKAAKKYKLCDPIATVDELSATFKTLPKEYFFNPYVDMVAFDLDVTDKKRILSHREWGRRPYTASDYRAEERTVVTSRGEHMRSKAEVIIAEKLYEYGIPFHYEQEVDVNGVTFHPDFTFEGAGREEFYLEFCGMMDDERYVKSHKRKRAMYEAAGIVPWKNIIYLYSQGNDMNVGQVVDVIKHQVIPWL